MTFDTKLLDEQVQDTDSLVIWQLLTKGIPHRIFQGT